MMAAKHPDLARKQDSTARCASNQFDCFRVYLPQLGRAIEAYRQEDAFAGEVRTAKGM